MCGIFAHVSKGTAFNSFRKYKEKYNISRRYGITQPELLSTHFLAIFRSIISGKNKIIRIVFPFVITDRRRVA